MYNLIRYTVFGLFVLSNVFISTAAVWNLSALQGADWSAPRSSDIYSIFLGCAGLLLIFPIFFCELAVKEVFLTRVWFELSWLGMALVMHLVGAAIATGVGQDQLCQRFLSLSRLDDGARCSSSRLLQAFSWICTITLLFYFLLLMVFTLLTAKDDTTIWQCHVRQFPWYADSLQLSSAESPGGAQVARKVSKISVPRFRSKPPTPVLAAPRPRLATNSEVLRGAILSYRSTMSQEYDIESYQPDARPIQAPALAVTMAQRPTAPMVSLPSSSSGPSLSFYPEHMRGPFSTATTSVPSARHSGEPLSPGPNPLGSWPQVNPPVRRPGDKRKTQHTLRSPSQEQSWAASQQDGLASPPPPAVHRPSHHRRTSGPRRSSNQIDSFLPVASPQAPLSIQFPTYGGGTQREATSSGRTLL